MDKKIVSWILLTFTMFFWGMSFVWTRQLLNHFSPITIISLRLLISSLFLFAFSLLIRRLQKVKKSDIKYFILLSFFQPFLYFIFEGYGIKATSASFAAIVIATIPLFTPLGARLVLKERISIMNFIGLIVSFAGVAFIIFDKSMDAKFTIVGLLILLGAVISAVGYLLVLKNVADKYNTFSVATWQNFFGIFFFLPFFFTSGLKEINQVAFSLEIIYPLLALAILASSIAFIFNTYGVRELGPSKAAAFTNSVPIFTLIFAYFIIDETIGWVKIMGITVVLIGLFLAQRNKKKEKTREGIPG